MGTRNPERHRPFLVGPEPLTDCTDDWSIFATCGNCQHERRLGLLKHIRGASQLKTVRDLKKHLRCSRCGASEPSLKADFVGKRRD